MSWSRRFDEPIVLTNGKKLLTLKEAIAWLAKEIPKSERMKQVQATLHFATQAAENNGPMICARMAMMQAINRHHVTGFTPSKIRIGESES
jgi:hypothetical protein